MLETVATGIGSRELTKFCCDIAAIAALISSSRGGLIPQALHGRITVFALAVAGSKVAGTGFEKEQMGQIQVAFSLSCVVISLRL